MSRFLSLSVGLLLAFLVTFAAPLHAQDALTGAIESLRTEIQALDEASLGEAEKTELRDIYQQTLTHLQRTEKLTEQLAELQTQKQEAPARIRSARQELEDIEVEDLDKMRASFEARELGELERALGEKVARMFNAQNELTAINSELIAAQTRPERTQASISKNQTRENELNDQIRALQRQGETPVNQARIRLLRAEQQSLHYSSDLLRQRLAANNLLQDLAAQQRDLLAQQISSFEVEIQILQDVINEKRRSQSEQTVTEATEQALQASNHQLLSDQGAINRQLSEELLRATTQVGELTRKGIQTKQQVDSLGQIESALEQQIDVLEGSVLLSRILHQQKQALPSVRYDATLADQIADLRLRQFELNQLRDEIVNPTAYRDRLINRLPEEQREELRDEFEGLVSSRISLVDKLSDNINTLLSLAISVQINQRQIEKLSDDLERRIDDQLFWVASNRPVDRAWLLDLPRKAAEQWNVIEPLVQLKKLGDILLEHIVWLVLLGLLLGFYNWRLPALREQLRNLHEDVGHFRRDSVHHTPRALMLTALTIIPVPMVLVSVGLLLSLGEEPAMPALGQGLSELALAWFIIHLLYRVFDPQGIATRHFRWEPAQVSRLRRLTRRAAWILLPLVLVVATGEILPEQIGDDVMGRLFMLVGMVGLAWLLGRMMQRSEPIYDSRVLHLLAALILTLAPLALAGLVAWGYNYTAIKLADRFISTLYLITIWMLFEGTVVRNLNVAGRRLAYQRALSKRQTAEQPHDYPEPEATIDVPEMDIQQINQQSLRLARLGLTIMFSVLVYFTWSDLISAASYLESVTMWEYNAGTADNPQMAPISAGDLLGALTIVALTFTLGRNLPGLLEMLVLSRMELRQGSSYAITTLLSYTIVSLGIFFALSALGVSWNKLQWLVAALGVGLGFGLQEIFANFVSGLIILFERPVRIGDVVTIGPLSGTVNKIRIRATTITDFDRKEIIVPNKTFVTEQLINWSLDDTITRVSLKLGIAHGADLAKTKELLMQIADDNPRVLKDPEPMVLFLNFGDHRLEHELRIHVRELMDRNFAIDEINREVDRQFREHGIVIAYRQLDINLRNSDGLERVINSRTLAAGPAQQAANGDTQPVSIHEMPTAGAADQSLPNQRGPDGA
ncbi:mechanosensitive channel MscK [Pseudomonas profundi]|uniref:mechanosensitive channel MscK n=1 Tax=Pseudomonas profundi TaxID=1981513 RepID=UPI001681A2AA|nr:mechanosensitive channel MscK [Pseudomonas profundi]